MPDGPDAPDASAPLDAPAERARRLADVEALRAEGIDPYPVRFDRDRMLAEVRAEFGDLGPGTETDTVVRVAGRVLLIRRQGKLTFATVPRPVGQRAALRVRRRARRGAPRTLRPARPRRLGRRRGHGHDHPSRRAQREGDRVQVAGQVAPAVARQVARPVRRRHALPAAVRRPRREPRGATGVRGAVRRGVRHPTNAGGARFRRGGDPGARPRARRRDRAALRHPPQLARSRSLLAHRDRAVPQAAGRRRLRARVRDRAHVPQRGHRHHPQPRVHDARGLPGLRRLPRDDGAHRVARRRSRARRARRQHRRHDPWRGGRPRGAVAARHDGRPHT